MSSSSDSKDDKWIPSYEFSKQSSHDYDITHDNLKSNANKLNQRTYTYSNEVSRTYYFDENIDRKTVNLKNGDVRTTPSVQVDTDFENILFEDTQILKHNDDYSSNKINNVQKPNIQEDNFKKKEAEMAYETRSAHAAVGFSRNSEKRAFKNKKIEPRKGRVREYSDLFKMVSLNAEKTVRTSTENPKYCVNDLQILQTRTYEAKNKLPAVNKALRSADIYDKQYEKTGNKEVIQFAIGDITKRKVDIIVNVLGNELNLKDGTLSKSIAIKAGQDVFTELRKQILVDKKDFIVTEGGRLLCKKIIHGILRHWDKPDECKRTLQYFMQNCLTLAESMNMRSIAFPAVGTGLPKFPPDVVASEMFSQAQSFSSSSVMTIEFVIFHDNMDVIRPFEAEMKKYLKDQTVRNKLSLHSSKPDNLFNMKSLLQSRESRSHINIRGEQNDQLENDLQYVSPDRRSDSSLPQFKYEATAPLMSSVDHHPCKNASAGRQHKTHGLYPSLLEHQDPSEEHVELEIKKYGEIVRQLKNIQKLVPCKADTSVEIRINKKGKIEVSGPKKFVSKTKRSIKSYLKRAEKAEEFSQYVEWGYWNHNGHVDLFEKLLGYDLEIKYKENIKSTQFDHDGTLLLVDYGSMIMQYAGDFETKYKIVRIPKDSVSSNVFYPSNWINMRPGMQCLEQEVDSRENIYNFIKDQFQQARRNIQICKILRVQNRHLYSQYKARQGALHEKNSKDSQQLLWHGTSEDCVNKIINNGFNRSYCGRNGTIYGKGVYFAVKVDLSLKYASTPHGIGHVFLASVAVGDTCKGHRDMQVLPSPEGRPKHITYDSACDDPSNPTMFVIFHDTQAYPSYHITFESQHIW